MVLFLSVVASCQITNPKSFERLQLSQIPTSQPSFSLSYGTDRQQGLDVYTPYGWNKTDSRPVIVHVHGGLRRFVNLFVADDDVRYLQGLETLVPAGETVSIIPAVAGG